jgi:hypothetical protein
MSRINTCKICAKSFETEGNHKHRYCPECKAKHKSPKDVAYYLKNKEKHKIGTINWQKNNPQRTKEIGKKTLQKKRYTVLLHYSKNPNKPICAHCEEDIIEFLAVDHIDNTGGKHRKLLADSSGNSMYNWIIKNNYPKSFQVLCHNCNWLKARGLRKTREIYECNKMMFSIEDNDCRYCSSNNATLYLNCLAFSEKIKKLTYERQFHQKVRLKVLSHYSKSTLKCSCCGQGNTDVLAIDHIDGEGNKERKSLNRTGGSNFYRWLINSNFPEGYQILCYNCNMAKGFYGSCPHKNS